MNKKKGVTNSTTKLKSSFKKKQLGGTGKRRCHKSYQREINTCLPVHAMNLDLSLQITRMQWPLRFDGQIAAHPRAQWSCYWGNSRQGTAEGTCARCHVKCGVSGCVVFDKRLTASIQKVDPRGIKSEVNRKLHPRVEPVVVVVVVVVAGLTARTSLVTTQVSTSPSRTYTREMTTTARWSA